jgi:ATP-binding cassette, subfamily B, bacterial PglK
MIGRMAYFSRVVTMLCPRQRLRLALVVAGMLLSAALEMLGIAAIPAFVALLTDPSRLIAHTPAAIASALRRMELARLTLLGAASLAAIILIKNAYLAFLYHVESKTLRDLSTDLSERLFRSYLFSPYAFHLRRNPAELIRNVTTEVAAVVHAIRASMTVMREGLTLSVVFLLLLLIDPVVSLSVFVLLGCAAATFYVGVRRALASRGELAQGHRSRQIQAATQALGAIKEAKIFGRETYFLEQFREETHGKEQQDSYHRVVAALPRMFLEVIAIVGLLLVAVVFVTLQRPVETMLPILTLLAVSIVRLVPAFNAVASGLSQIHYYQTSVELVCEELASARLVQQGLPTSSASPRLTTSVRLRNIRYRYPDAHDNALRGVSLEIPVGSTVAIIGPSGAGKSTLVDVLLGLLTPTDGDVQVDGWSISQHLAGWQHQIGYVPQDVYLLDASVRRNVAFGLPENEIDDRRVLRALRLVQMDAFVSALARGLETEVGNRGIRLSGGQRQRLGIARALYNEPPVLVMDEATAALDHETEQAVLHAMGALNNQHTVVLIAHRLTTVRHCDVVFLIESGVVKDSGTFDELCARNPYLRAGLAVHASNAAITSRLNAKRP